MSLASFGIRRPVVADLVMYALIGAGLIFGIGLRREFFPEIQSNQVLVTAPYPGASPEEIEQNLAIKIEDAIDDLDDIDEINTTASEGVATVRITFEDGVDITERLFEVKREMDALQDLPEASERIVITELEPNLPVCVLSLISRDGTDERTLKEEIQRIRDDLRRLPGMGTIQTSGLRRDEITVEVMPERLIEHNLSITDVQFAIRGAMIELPGGAVQGSTQNTAVRSVGAEEQVSQIRGIIVKAAGEGQAVRVDEVARVSLGFEDIDLRERLNGRPSNSLTILKTGKQDAVDMADMVKAYVAGRKGEEIELSWGERFGLFMATQRAKGDKSKVDLAKVSPRLEAYEIGRTAKAPPPGDLVITTDLARFIVGRLDLLSRNALAGGVLVLVTLLLLLNFRVAFWTAIGLGVSLLATLAAMHFAGYTLNLLTMFGLIIVLGLLVDDAIVVAENITSRHEGGEPPEVAATRGTEQVTWPVIATVLTTICAFLPLALIEGSIGDLLGALPAVVTLSLLVSLVECLFILPAHMSHSLKALDKQKKRAKPGVLTRLDRAMDPYRERLFSKWLIPAYIRVLRVAIVYRYISVAIAVAVMLCSFGLVASGIVSFTFLKSADSETVNVELKMPIGTPVSETDRLARIVEEEILGNPEVTSVFASLGRISSLDGASPGSSATHLAQLIMELSPVESRQGNGERSSEMLINDIRAALEGRLVGVESIRFEEVQGGPSGPGLTYTLVGESLDVILPAVDEMKVRMAKYEGVADIADNREAGRRELRIKLRDSARELGFTDESVARQVRGIVFGLEAHTYAGEQEDVDVRVIFPEETRRSLSGIEGADIFTPMGDPVPLSEVAELTTADGYATLRRLDQRPAVTVSAEVNTSVTNNEEVAAAIAVDIAEVERMFPGVRVVEQGRQKETTESFASLPLGMLTAVALIYVILAWLFGNFLQPVVVLSAVPFATIGMIVGHLVLGFDMTMLSLIGFIALTGVVVNDSLIFISFYNTAREDGLSVAEACLTSGRARLRPIILTTVTTVFGLLPLMLEQSFQARFLIPMAITIAGGLVSATAIILLVIPCFLQIGDDLRRSTAWLLGGDRDGVDAGLDRRVG